MKKMGLALLLLVLGTVLKAQQNRFVYIQTENRQPFYVKVDKKLFSSSASGYIIIPKLTDGAYSFSIGFPKSEWPEQQINCTVDKKDAGYLLKNFGDKGWGLFNLQTMEVSMAGSGAANNTPSGENRDDAFSNILSTVAKDSTIRKKPPVVKADPPPAVVATPEPAKATPPVVAVQEPVKTDPVISKPADRVRKILDVVGQAGLERIYVVENGGTGDTVRIFIPVVKEPVVTETPKVNTPAPVVTDEKPADTVRAVMTIPAKQVAEPDKPKEKFIDMELPNPNAKQPPGKEEPGKDTVIEVKKQVEPPKQEVKEPQPAAKPTVQMVNSDCKETATDDDFMKLRKKMAAADNDDDMVAVAKKVFRSKCFTTEQIRNLSVLFLKDDGKYKFFDAAYPRVHDSEHFSELQAQLTQEYYINRFKAMIRH